MSKEKHYLLQRETTLALQCAKQAHEGELRSVGPDTGLSYFDTHILRVVKAVSERAKPAAAIHDVVEGDRGITLDGLRSTEQFSEVTLEAVELLTRRDAETYFEYIDRIVKSGGDTRSLEIAREVKLADLVDNFITLPHGSLRKRYLKAIHLLTKSYL